MHAECASGARSLREHPEKTIRTRARQLLTMWFWSPVARRRARLDRRRRTSVYATVRRPFIRPFRIVIASADLSPRWMNSIYDLGPDIGSFTGGWPRPTPRSVCAHTRMYVRVYKHRQPKRHIIRAYYIFGRFCFDILFIFYYLFFLSDFCRRRSTAAWRVYRPTAN